MLDNNVCVLLYGSFCHTFIFAAILCVLVVTVQEENSEAVLIKSHRETVQRNFSEEQKVKESGSISEDGQQSFQPYWIQL